MNIYFLLLLPFFIVVAAAPIGTTILGWVAVAQIRRSAGKLHGLGLAVFDGLLFPLLALDGLIWWVWRAILLGFVYPLEAIQDGSTTRTVGASPGAPALLVILLIDWLIIRAVWRAVDQSVRGEGPAAAKPSEPPKRSTLGTLALALAFVGLAVPLLAVQLAPPSSAATVFAAMIVVFLACQLAALILAIVAWRSLVGKTALAAAVLCCVLWGNYAARQADRQYRNVLGTDAGAVASFGPVEERIVTVGNDARSFYSFDREAYVPGPTDFDPTDHDRTYGDLWKWLTKNHVDVFASQRNGKPVLIRCEMVTRDLNEDEFDTLTPARLASNRDWQAALKAQMRGQESSIVSRGKLRGDKDTFVFENRFGVTGLIQVVGITSDPAGVTIRYKLLQTAGAALTSAGGNAAAATASAPAALPAGAVDQASLQGTWVGEGGRQGGGPAGEWRLAITNDTVRVEGPSSGQWYVGKFTLRPNTSPTQGELVITDCPAPDYVGKTSKAIFTLEGNTLTFAAHEPGNPALPTGFDPNQAGTLVVVLKKQ